MTGQKMKPTFDGETQQQTIIALRVTDMMVQTSWAANPHATNGQTATIAK